MRYLLAAALVALISLATATATLAAEQTITVNVKVTVPVINKTVIGVAVVKGSGTPDNISAVWTFTGTIDGQPASARGLAKGRFTGSGYEGQVTKIEAWYMAGLPRISVHTPLSLQQAAGQTIIGSAKTGPFGDISVPLTTGGADAMIAPFSGDLTLNVTNDTANAWAFTPSPLLIALLLAMGGLGVTVVAVAKRVWNGA